MKAGEVLAGTELIMASGSQLECRGRMGFKFPSGEGQGCVTSEAKLRAGCSKLCVQNQLKAHELVEAYEKGQLKGKLKEIAATLDEESNPVIMLAKYKK